VETPEEGMETPVRAVKTPEEGLKTPRRTVETPEERLEVPEKGMETAIRGVETIEKGMETPEKGMETPVRGLEIPQGGIEPTKDTPQKGMETTKDVLEITKKGLETTKDELETARDAKGVLETTDSLKENLETTREATGDLETNVPPTSGGLKTTSRRKAGLKTPRRLRGSVEAAESLDWGRSRSGDLETTREGLEQSRDGVGIPEPMEIPDTPGIPLPKSQASEESVVILLGEEEEEEEEVEVEVEHSGDPGWYLVALDALQVRLEAMKEQTARAIQQIQAQFRKRSRPHLRRRNRLIQHIPSFWVTAFLNHPQLSAMISDRDEDALSYMTNLQVSWGRVGGCPGGIWSPLPKVTQVGLQVEEFGQSHPGYRIRFFFSINPYFQNDVLAKEFMRGPSGHLVSHSTPIRWWQGQNPCSQPHKDPLAPRSFFAWFGDHSFP
ncbi:TSYL2 protein, partial [Formicarius rufipectus]|nr:TSYL2 protein [Formicarius rufipectus]